MTRKILQEVVERKVVRVKEGEPIKKAATLYKKSATEHKERDTANTTATIGSGEKEI